MTKVYSNGNPTPVSKYLFYQLYIFRRLCDIQEEWIATNTRYARRFSLRLENRDDIEFAQADGDDGSNHEDRNGKSYFRFFENFANFTRTKI